jgi:medium-chain acyl-[acyl-carrier-protein] hydrolase
MPRYFYEKDYEIRSYDCDYLGRVSPLSLFNYMQDLASTDAENLGFSVQHLMEKKMTWVLSRIHLKIEKVTYWKDKLKGGTWPSGRQGRYAMRDFRLRNAAGETIAVASSSWMVLDLEKRIPLKLENLGDIDFFEEEERALPDDFSPLPEQESFDAEKKIAVRFSDLDINRHVNHVAYINWGLEGLNEEVLFKKYPMEIEVQYRKEVFYKDRILSRSKQSDSKNNSVFLHMLLLEEGGQEIARLRTRWG